MFGLAYAAIRYESRLPCPSSYECKAAYILPFEGAWIVVNGGVTEELSHSWDVYNQRFAYDFVILDEHAKTHHGDLANPQNYYCYGQKVLAPADGTVVFIEDRCDDSRIDGKKAYCDSGHIAGNHIIIKHADDEFSFLAHLKKDSIIVKTGAVVTQSQHIANCGNTGNSSEPHLPFHSKNEPKCVLYGIDRSSFMGDNLNILGWYVTEEDAQKELSGISEAMRYGEGVYALKYYVKVKKGIIAPKILN